MGSEITKGVVRRFLFRAHASDLQNFSAVVVYNRI